MPADRVDRVNVLGVGVSAIDPAGAFAAVEAAVRTGEGGYVCVTGVHGVSEAQADPAFRRVLNDALLVTPDGVPMVWMGHLQHHPDMARVYGPDLMLAILEASPSRGWTHYFYGGANGAAAELRTRMEARFPGLQVVGHFEPPFRPLDHAEEQALLDDVHRTRPTMLWVGLSTPKQERFMAEYYDRLQVPVLFGVGAAFDFHTGRVAQAPAWMQRRGLEWFYRLCREPRRLWRRYLRNNPLFVGRAVLQLTGARKYEITPPSTPHRSEQAS